MSVKRRGEKVHPVSLVYDMERTQLKISQVKEAIVGKVLQHIPIFALIVQSHHSGMGWREDLVLRKKGIVVAKFYQDEQGRYWARICPFGLQVASSIWKGWEKSGNWV